MQKIGVKPISRKYACGHALDRHYEVAKRTAKVFLEEAEVRSDRSKSHAWTYWSVEPCSSPPPVQVMDTVTTTSKPICWQVPQPQTPSSAQSSSHNFTIL